MCEGKKFPKEERKLYETFKGRIKILYQGKAWADEKRSLQTLDILEEFCLGARILDVWKVLNLDNLDGQVTAAFRDRLTELKFLPCYSNSQLTHLQNVNDGGTGKQLGKYFLDAMDDHCMVTTISLIHPVCLSVTCTYPCDHITQVFFCLCLVFIFSER